MMLGITAYCRERCLIRACLSRHSLRLNTKVTYSTTMSILRRVGKISPSSTVFLLCDIQERFRSVIWNYPHVIKTAKLMTDVGRTLSIPTIATEQYPKAMGPTVPEIPLEVDGYRIKAYEKKLFSMVTEEVKAELDTLAKPSVVLFGIEAHVCVQQTALDLLEQGYDVHVLVDGCSSQRPIDRAVALRRMESAGAFVTTAESLIFMLTQSANHPQFKIISGLIKEHGATENPFNSTV